jgi:hypothetical protein
MVALIFSTSIKLNIRMIHSDSAIKKIQNKKGVLASVSIKRASGETLSPMKNSKITGMLNIRKMLNKQFPFSIH